MIECHDYELSVWLSDSTRCNAGGFLRIKIVAVTIFLAFKNEVGMREWLWTDTGGFIIHWHCVCRMVQNRGTFPKMSLEFSWTKLSAIVKMRSIFSA